MSRLSVAQWRDLVFASKDPRMTSAVKLLCLWLADRMDQRTRKVSVPRETIALALGVHKARIGERLTKAVDAGYLSRVSPGYLGHTSVYQAIRPSCVLQSGTHMDTDPPDASPARRAVRIPAEAEREPGPMDTAPLDANTQADPSPVGHHRHVGNDEEQGA